jgi:hypothetical protein
MASSYTANNGIEKIGTGEQAGTWGATTNTNFDILDRAINGVGSITLSGTTHTLTTTDGALSDGHFKVLVFGGTLSSTNTVTISPNDQDKLYFVFNNTSGGQSIIIKQGSGATVTVGNGKTAIVYADGAGSGAAVAQIETGSDEFTEDVTMKTDDGALLTLQTSATAITDGNVLGALQFQAPNESDGSDGALVSASIVGEADATFSATVNSTDLVFNLGTDGAVAEKMRLTHEGDLELQNDLTLKSDSSIIKFGADSEIQLTHHADTGLKIKHTATADDKPVILTLQTGEEDIQNGDVLGAIEFQAPDETTGTDAQVSAGRIEVQSEGDFSATNNAAMIVFKTGEDGTNAGTPLERFRIESSGSCGIAADGSATINHLRVGASADLKIYHDGSNTYVRNSTGEVVILTTTDSAVTLQHNSATKLNTTSSGVTVSGTLTATEVTATSDERLKSDIKTIDNALDKVMNMRGVSFTKQAEKGIGVIAQEVEKIIPEVVHDGEYKSVAYGNIVGVLIEAIKEQQKQIDELKKDKHGPSD